MIMRGDILKTLQVPNEHADTIRIRMATLFLSVLFSSLFVAHAP